MEVGTVAFYSSQMIAWEDLARCAEPTAGFLYRQNWSSTGSLGSIYSAYLSSLDPEKRQELVETSPFVAANRDVSEPDRAACASGMEAMRKAHQAGRCEPIPEGSPSHRSGLLGNQFACDAEVFATLIPDEEWHPRREEVRRTLGQRFLELH
jgi:hypothetical protein